MLRLSSILTSNRVRCGTRGTQSSVAQAIQELNYSRSADAEEADKCRPALEFASIPTRLART